MPDEVAPCPACRRSLRLVQALGREVTSSCPACGAGVLVAIAPHAMTLIDTRKLTGWRVRQILKQQRLDMALSTGSTSGIFGVVAVALATGGHSAYAAISVTVTIVLAAGAGVLPVAFDARNGAAEWRRTLRHVENILVAMPEGYRA
jgi:hypothetical protein